MKVKFLVFTVVWLFLISAQASGQGSKHSFFLGNTAYSVDVSDEDLKDTPSWNPEKEETAPLAVGEAVKIARTNLARWLPKKSEGWNLESFKLNQMGEDKWIYEIHFRCRSEKCGDNYDSFFVYVKMDGTIIEPKIKTDDEEK